MLDFKKTMAMVIAVLLPVAAATAADEAKPAKAVKVQVLPVESGKTITLKTEKVTYVGIASAPVSQAMRAQLDLPTGVGLLVQHVMPKSPAAEAGLKQNDILHKLSDQLLVNAEQMRTLVRTHKPGDELKFTIIRKGKSQQLAIKAGEREAPVVQPGQAHRMMRLQPGMKLQNADEAAKQLQKQLQDMKLDLQVGPNGQVDIEKIRKQIQEQMQKAMKKHGQAIQQHRIQIGPNGVVGNASSSAMYSDGTHTLTLKTEGDNKHLIVKDKAGKVIFDGPVNTDKEKAKLPADVADKFKRLQSNTKIRINIQQLPAGPRVPPAPGGPGPEAF